MNQRLLMAKFLLKYATRGRPGLFCKTLTEWTEKLSGNNDVTFVISVDDQDESMKEPRTYEAMISAQRHDKVDVYRYSSPEAGKIKAINRDIEKHSFDILVCVSDDMGPIVDGYDDIIVGDMQKHWPDLDGVLHYNDGHVNHQLMTLSIMGKTYYDRFGYIYHPDYTSLWCDNEAMEVAKSLGKHVYIDRCIIEHRYKGHGDDLTYQDSEKNYQRDRAVFDLRREQGFPKETRM